MKQLRRPRLDRPGGRHALPLAAWHELGRARAVILIENEPRAVAAARLHSTGHGNFASGL